MPEHAEELHYPEHQEGPGELLVAAFAPSLGQTLAPYAIALSHIAAVAVGLFVAANSDGVVSGLELQNILIGFAGTVGVYFVPLLPNAPFANIVKTIVASAAALIAGVFTAIEGGTPSDWLTFGALAAGAILTGIVDNAPALEKNIRGAVTGAKAVADAVGNIEVK